MTGAGRAVQLPELPAGKPPAQSAQRANSLPHALPQVTDATERDESRRVQDAAARVTALLSGPSLLHARPASLAETHGHHRQAAAHFEAALLRWPRAAWGGLHLVIVAGAELVKWLTRSPVTAVTAFAVYTALHFWLLRFLPWF